MEDREAELAEVVAPLEPHGMDPADSATDEFDHDMALCLLAHEEDAIREIDDAMRRIVAGTYGICEETGRRIPAARLRVVPWTRFTKEAKEGRERGGVDALTRLASLETLQGPDAAMLENAEDPERGELLAREITRREREKALSAGGPRDAESEALEPEESGPSETREAASAQRRPGTGRHPARRAGKPSGPAKRRSSKRP